MATTNDIILRPVRPSDRDRVAEMTSDIWEGHDYIESVFDDWVSDATAAFQAVEHLFESAGFKPLLDVRWWRAPRVEGGEPANMPDAVEAEKLWKMAASSPGFEMYNGVSADPNGARNLEAAELGRLASRGMLRVAPGGRALAGLRRPWSDNVSVAFLAGRGAALRDLLFALRYEADADAADHVTIALPRGHPAADDMRATGYDFANAEDSAFIYGLKLKPQQHD